MESPGKIIEYNISHENSWKSQSLKDYKLYAFIQFQIKTMKLTKLMIFMQQMQHSHLVRFARIFLGDITRPTILDHESSIIRAASPPKFWPHAYTC